MKWFFSKRMGGRDCGPNDSGIETFRGDFFRYLARELIQNSLDARHDPSKPVVVRFDHVNLPLAEFPDADTLASVIHRCREYFPKDKKAGKFFEAGEALLKKETIPCLRIGDFNTTGVRGGDAARDKEWYHLIRCSGSSSKGAGEGGSYGIGKNAPFAASDLRAVLYSTKNTDKEVAFQGVASLVTHQHPEGGLAEAVGYLGGRDGASVRKAAEIPERFLRDKLGTDIWVMGFHVVKDWKAELLFSVLDNFWPAIHFRDLEVFVGDLRISFENLAAQLNAHAGKDDFTAHQYFKAFTGHTQHVGRDLPTLDRADLYLLAGDMDLGKRVAMIRSSGMVIEQRLFRSPMSFCGVFLCRSERGNRTLREMEPPRHDVWDPNHPDKGANKKTEAEFVSFIRECVRALTPADDSKSLSIPELGRFLPDDDESPEESFDQGGDEGSKMETADRRAKPQKLEGRRIDPSKRQLQPDDTKPGAGLDETEQPGGDGSGGGTGGKPNDGTGGTGGGGGGGKGKGDGAGGQGGPGGSHGKPPIPIFFRTFSRNPPAGVYVAVVTPKKDGSARAVIKVSEIGDDGAKIPAEIRSARTPNGQEQKVAGNMIGPLAMPAGAALRLELVLATPAKVSMGVEAHEAE